MSSAADLDESLDRSTGSSPQGPARRTFGARTWRDGPLWLVLVAVAFTLSEFTPSLLKLPLGADEITYIAQTSAHASAVILPPVPAFYAAPRTLEDIVDQTVGRALDFFGQDWQSVKRWGENIAKSKRKGAR